MPGFCPLRGLVCFGISTARYDYGVNTSYSTQRECAQALCQDNQGCDMVYINYANQRLLYIFYKPYTDSLKGITSKFS